MMKAKPKKIGQQSTAITKGYEPTPEERAALNAFLAERAKIPRAKVEDIKGQAVLSLHHKDQAYGHALLMTGLATVDAEFAGEILVQLGRASVQNGKVNERELNFKLAVVKGIQPKDQLETLLAAQMAAVHSLAMSMASSVNGITTLPQLEIHGRLLNNLTRTFALQMEALKRHRSTGEQKVTVEHVSVNDGGKALFGIGKVTQEGPGFPGKQETTP